MAKRHLYDSTIAFQWSRVSLNIPANIDYDHIKPPVQLLHHDGRITVGCIAFSDDDRIYAPDNKITQTCILQMCPSLQWVGIQEVARKRRSGGMRSGAWSGACVLYRSKYSP